MATITLARFFRLFGWFGLAYVAMRLFFAATAFAHAIG